MSVEPACRSSPVWGFMSMLWRGCLRVAWSLLVVLVPTRCLFYRARACTFEGVLRFFLSTVSWCVGGADDSSSLTLLFFDLPVSVGWRVLCGQLGAERERTATLADDISFTVSLVILFWLPFLAARALGGSMWLTYWYLLGTCAGRSNFTSLLGISCQCSSGTLHGTRWGSATMGLSCIFLELVATVVPALAVQVTLPYGNDPRLRLGCGPRKRIGGCRRKVEAGFYWC